MLDQRRRRWADVVQMLCKCFVFAGQLLITHYTAVYEWHRLYIIMIMINHVKHVKIQISSTLSEYPFCILASVIKDSL